MKTLITTILLVISWQSFAQSAFNPVSKEGANQFYSLQEDCEKIEGQACYDTANCPVDECILIDEVDDIGIYTGRKLLRASPVRKAAKEAKGQAEKDAEILLAEKKKNSEDRIKSVDWSKVKTIADLKAIVQDLIELNKGK